LDSVTVEWTQTADTFANIDKSKLPHLDEKGLYAILGAVFDKPQNQWTKFNLLYIGQAFDQTLRVRIPQPHDAYACFDENLKKTTKTAIVMVGIVTQASVKPITQSLFDDVECCLIHSNQPLCNTDCKAEYKGRPLKITNTEGYPPLKPASECAPKPSPD